MSDLRPTLFLAQLPNLLAGNISLVHGVVGSSRTFMGEEAAGVDAVRVAQARVASGQSELTLVGGAYNGARWDVLLAFELGGVLLQGQIRAGLGSRAERRHRLRDHGGVFGAGKPGARAKRAAQNRGRGLSEIHSDRNLRKPGDTEAALRRQWEAIASKVDRAHAGDHFRRRRHRARDLRRSARVLKEIGLPVRNTGTYIGHGVETQFMANLGIACAALEHGKLFAPAGSGDTGESPPGLSQVIVTSVGNWRGEGLALVERID